MKKDKKEKNSINSCGIKTSIGGQALIEGIMMRGPKNTAMAVKRADGSMIIDKWKTSGKPNFPPIKPLGEAETADEALTNDAEIKETENESIENNTKKKKNGFVKTCTKIPFVRGIFNMIISLSLGYKCLMRSADVFITDAPEEPVKEAKEGRFVVYTDENIKSVSLVKQGEMKSFKLYRSTGKNAPEQNTDAATGFATVIGTVLGFALAIGLFIVVPAYISKWIMQLANIDYTSKSYSVTTARSAIEGGLKVLIMVGYMWVVSLMKDIRRTFMYHGAEHKTIFCYEQGLDLTVENIKKQRRFHPRCGTSFIVLTVLVSIIVGIFIPSSIPTWLRSIIKFLCLPLTMGISYELIKIAGKHDNVITRIISAPGMWLQHITTKEPDDDMIECAIAAMNEVIPDDKSDRID